MTAINHLLEPMRVFKIHKSKLTSTGLRGKQPTSCHPRKLSTHDRGAGALPCRMPIFGRCLAPRSGGKTGPGRPEFAEHIGAWQVHRVERWPLGGPARLAVHF
jgi:hypothetical protein